MPNQKTMTAKMKTEETTYQKQINIFWVESEKKAIHWIGSTNLH